MNIDIASFFLNKYYIAGFILFYLYIFYKLYKKLYLWPSLITSLIIFAIPISGYVPFLILLKFSVVLYIVGLIVWNKINLLNNRKKTVLFYLFILNLIYIFVKAFSGFLQGYSIESIGVAIFTLSQPLIFGILTLLTIDGIYRMIENRIFLILPIIFTLTLSLIFFGIRITFGSATIGGYASHLYIFFSILFPRKRKNFLNSFTFFLSTLDILLGGSRRYLVPLISPLIITSFRRLLNSNILFKLTIFILLLFAILFIISDHNYISFLTQNDTISRGEGYRGTERRLMLATMESMGDYLFGHFGYQINGVTVGTKGIWHIGPTGHSFWVTMIFNCGIVGLLLFLTIPSYISMEFIKIILNNKRMKFSYFNNLLIIYLFYLGWLVTANFDAPRDGHWLLGFLPSLFVIASSHTKISFKYGLKGLFCAA